MNPAQDVPVLDSPRRRFGEVSANLSAPEWRDVPVVDFVEATGGGVPMQATQVRCAWDERELRVLYTCVDSEVWATMTMRNDRLWEEEVVEIFIDPVGDGEGYFEIEVNPLNTVLDLALRRNRSGWKKDFAWDCDGFRSAIERTDSGWNAELAIPFAALSSELPQPGTEWRVNFCRIDRPPGIPRELTAWSPTYLGTFHAPRRFGRLRFQ